MGGVTKASRKKVRQSSFRTDGLVAQSTGAGIAASGVKKSAQGAKSEGCEELEESTVKSTLLEAVADSSL
jgi:hypothetical protein